MFKYKFEIIKVQLFNMLANVCNLGEKRIYIQIHRLKDIKIKV